MWRVCPTPPAGIQLVSYADDTTIAATGVDVSDLVARLNDYIPRIIGFLAERDLEVSAEKSTATLFSTWNREPVPPDIVVNGDPRPTGVKPKNIRGDTRFYDNLESSRGIHHQTRSSPHPSAQSASRNELGMWQGDHNNHVENDRPSSSRICSAHLGTRLGQQTLGQVGYSSEWCTPYSDRLLQDGSPRPRASRDQDDSAASPCRPSDQAVHHRQSWTGPSVKSNSRRTTATRGAHEQEDGLHQIRWGCENISPSCVCKYHSPEGGF